MARMTEMINAMYGGMLVLVVPSALVVTGLFLLAYRKRHAKTEP